MVGIFLQEVFLYLYVRFKSLLSEGVFLAPASIEKLDSEAVSLASTIDTIERIVTFHHTPIQTMQKYQNRDLLMTSSISKNEMNNYANQEINKRKLQLAMDKCHIVTECILGVKWKFTLINGKQRNKTKGVYRSLEQ